MYKRLQSAQEQECALSKWDSLFDFKKVMVNNTSVVSMVYIFYKKRFSAHIVHNVESFP